MEFLLEQAHYGVDTAIHIVYDYCKCIGLFHLIAIHHAPIDNK